MKRKSAVIILILILVIALVAYELDVWQKEVSRRATENAPYDLAYDSFRANVTNEAAAAVKNNSANFPLLNKSPNRLFSGDYVVLTEGYNGHFHSFSYRDQKILDYSHLNLTVIYAIKTTDRLAGTYSDGSRGYDARYDLYLIKYPEKTPIGKESVIGSPPEKIVGKEGEKIGDQIGNDAVVGNWINAHHG